jgi:hypothetical protein
MRDDTQKIGLWLIIIGVLMMLVGYAFGSAPNDAAQAAVRAELAAFTPKTSDPFAGKPAVPEVRKPVPFRQGNIQSSTMGTIARSAGGRRNGSQGREATGDSTGMVLIIPTPTGRTGGGIIKHC